MRKNIFFTEPKSNRNVEIYIFRHMTFIHESFWEAASLEFLMEKKDLKMGFMMDL